MTFILDSFGRAAQAVVLNWTFVRVGTGGASLQHTMWE